MKPKKQRIPSADECLKFLELCSGGMDADSLLTSPTLLLEFSVKAQCRSNPGLIPMVVKWALEPMIQSHQGTFERASQLAAMLSDLMDTTGQGHSKHFTEQQIQQALEPFFGGPVCHEVKKTKKG